ncbi:hypothetical protein [Bradyrhizobium yuanmingense]|uniref:hypothetical protein n=1 Tax=Bradyrhizobium yuanmingense TaxID=108015 RepID=UPI0031B8152F
MRLILQADKPDDFVLATGETRSVREMVGLGVCAGWPLHGMGAGTASTKPALISPAARRGPDAAVSGNAASPRRVRRCR